MKNEKITIKEMKEKANIKNLSNGAIKFYIKDLQDEGKGKRAIINKLIKEDEKITEYKNAKHIKDMTITIEWKKSRTWGANPHAQIKGHYIDNSYFYDNNDFTCSGCGYDKESTVLSQIFNKYFRYQLYKIKKNNKKAKGLPYGANIDTKFNPYFEYGVGTNCYFKLVQFFGGKMQHVASGKMFDTYYVEFKK
jgi:hypothetical protein